MTAVTQHARCAHLAVCETCRAAVDAAADRPAPPDVLTPRQVAIMQMLADGLPLRQIATRLHIAYETVRTHLTRIYLAIGVQGQAGAVAWALRHGVIQ
jgi:LuxR family transcriptional regulator, maltose regulon positive regulatory protein